MQDIERISSRILTIRGHRVMVDADLAALYGVTTKRLNEQVKRNRRRFPPPFVFQLTPVEKNEVVAKCDHLSRLRFAPGRPNVFTEHGALMASAVLNTPRAVQISVYVIEAFVHMRNALSTSKVLGQRLNELERRVGTHDRAIGEILGAIRQLTTSPDPPKRKRIGFVHD